jgi:hypothetical protein
MAVKGTWFGLPDFGLTEKYTSLKANPLAVQNYGAPSSYQSAPMSLGGQSIQGGTSYSLGKNVVNTPSAVLSANTGGTSGVSGSVSGIGQVQQQQAGGTDPYAGMSDAARSQAQIELEQALQQYDYYAEQAQNQKAGLGTQKASALSEMGTALGRSQTQAKASTEQATAATNTAKNKALSTAQDVTKSNRNVLRALGILSSSAAGEMLQKPMNEYGTQAADLEQGLIQRKNVVDTWLQERTQEHQTAVQNLESQYSQLINNIDTDLRFNDRQRVTAVKAAQSALQTRLSEIEQSKMQYQQAAQNYNANIISQIAQIQLYQNPNADVSKLLGTLINPGTQQYGGGQVATQQTEEQRKRLSGLGY